MDCQSQARSQFYKIVTNCKYNDCSVYTLYLPSLIELWDLALFYMVILGFQTRSRFYEILIVTNCKSNDVSSPSNPEYELCLPPFGFGLIRLVLVLHGLSVSDSVLIVTNCKYNDCSVYALHLPSLIELWDL